MSGTGISAGKSPGAFRYRPFGTSINPMIGSMTNELTMKLSKLTVKPTAGIRMYLILGLVVAAGRTLPWIFQLLSAQCYGDLLRYLAPMGCPNADDGALCDR